MATSRNGKPVPQGIEGAVTQPPIPPRSPFVPSANRTNPSTVSPPSPR